MDWRKPGVEVEKPVEEKGVLGGPGIRWEEAKKQMQVETRSSVEFLRTVKGQNF